MSVSRRNVLVSAFAIGAARSALVVLAAPDPDNGPAAVLVDGELHELLRAHPSWTGTLHPLESCFTLNFGDLSDRLRRMGAFVAVLEPATHLLVLEAVRDTFGRILLDCDASRIRPGDVDAQTLRLIAAATRYKRSWRVLRVLQC